MATSAMPLPFVEPATAYTDRREPSRLGRKLQQHLVLSPSEREALDRWLGRSVRRVRDRTPLVEEGAPASNIHIIIDGWACRYRTAHDGRRQVVAILVPGRRVRLQQLRHAADGLVNRGDR